MTIEIRLIIVPKSTDEYLGVSFEPVMTLVMSMVWDIVSFIRSVETIADSRMSLCSVDKLVS